MATRKKRPLPPDENGNSIPVEALDLPEPGPVPADGNEGPLERNRRLKEEAQATTPISGAGQTPETQTAGTDGAEDEESHEPEQWVPKVGDRVQFWPEGLINEQNYEEEGSVRAILDTGFLRIAFDGGEVVDMRAQDLSFTWRPRIGDHVGMSESVDPTKRHEMRGVIVALSYNPPSARVHWTDDTAESYEMCDLRLVAAAMPEVIVSDTETIETTEEIPAWLAEIGQPNWRETRQIAVALTEERHQQLSDDLAESYRELEEVDAEKKRVTKRYNDRIIAIKERCSKRARTLNAGEEELPVSVGWWIDYGVGMKRCRRMDTGEILETLEIAAEEKQLKLQMDDDAHPDDQEGIEETDMLRCNACSWEWHTDAFYTSVPAVRCPQCDSPAISLHFPESTGEEQLAERTETINQEAEEADREYAQSLQDMQELEVVERELEGL